MQANQALRQLIQPFTAAIPVFILFITLLSVPLAAAEQMNLTPAQTSSWIVVSYGVAGVLSIVLTLIHRQPLLVTGSIFVLIFVASLGDQVPYAELIGACIMAGIIITVITLLGIIQTVARLIPEPIVLALLAGAIMPIVIGIFTSLVEAPVIVGSTFMAFIGGRWLLQDRLPAILPAMIVGLIAIAITGQFGTPSNAVSLPQLTITMPVFSLRTIATITPIFVVLITLQANVPAMIFMQTQDFDPPERTLNLMSGLGTIVTSFMGPNGVALSLPLTAIVTSPSAGEHSRRYQAIFFTGTLAILIALLSGLSVSLPDVIPLPFLLSLAGLSFINVLLNALQVMTRGPLRLAPLFTFIIALSQITFLGLGAFFWALIVGTTIAFTLEREERQQLNQLE